MKRRLIVNLLILANCTTNSSTTLSPEEKETIVKEVKYTLDNYFADIKKSGVMAEFNYLDSSADFYWVPPGYSSAIDYDSVAAILRNVAPRYTHIDNSFNSIMIVPLSRDLASYTGQVRSIMTDTSGVTSSFDLVETGIVIKRRDQWKLINGQTGLIKPAD